MRLQGKVAVVTGATRGAGRGIATVLGQEGATVYVTGRSVRGAVSMGRPDAETIEAAAEAVAAGGGQGIPVRVDHTDDAQVAALFERVQREQGRLDLLVNAVWGGNEVEYAEGRAFWERPPELWPKMFDAGVKAAFTASRFAAPLLVSRRQGLVINVSFKFSRYDGFLHYYVGKAALNAMAEAMAGDLRPHGVAALALSPGWMRTELVLAAFKATEANWQQVPALARTETPLYAGRAVVALAADPNVQAKSGGTHHVGDLAREYGFTDVDGRQPPAFLVE